MADAPSSLGESCSRDADDALSLTELATAAVGVLTLLIAVYWSGRRKRPLITHAMQRHYSLSSTGFLMAAQSTALPLKFEAWEQLASRLPELNRAGKLRAAVDALSTIGVEPGELQDDALRRARVILTCLVHSYVFGHKVPWCDLQQQCPGGGYKYVSPTEERAPSAEEPLPALPEQLATPWRLVSSLLGMPLVLTATDADLWNSAPYARRDASPADWLPQYRQLFSMTRTRSERGFHAVPHAVNRALAPVVPALVLAPAHVKRRDMRALRELCTQLEAALSLAKSQLAHIYTEVDPSEFYDFYRFLLGGWPEGGLSLPASPAHKLAAGTAEHVGPSAGQTAVIILVDLVLGIEHGASLRAFQAEMRRYMPAAQTELLNDLDSELSKHGTLRALATAADAPRALRDAYAAACAALATMRAYHLGVATHFLRKALKGTGGSDFRALLDEGVVSTRTAVGCARGGA